MRAGGDEILEKGCWRQRIKQDLPNIPDEVVNIWLVPFAEDPAYGWPRLNNCWNYVLQRNSLDYWANTTWQRDELRLAEEDLTPDSQRAARAIYENNVLGLRNKFSNLMDTKRRFIHIHQHILCNGVVPRPVIMLETPKGLDTIDGHHRLSALFYVRTCWQNAEKRQRLIANAAIEPKRNQPVWICTPPQSGTSKIRNCRS